MRLTEGGTQRRAAVRAAPPAHGRTWACRLRWHRGCHIRHYRFVGGLSPCDCRCHARVLSVVAAPLPGR